MREGYAMLFMEMAGIRAGRLGKRRAVDCGRHIAAVN